MSVSALALLAGLALAQPAPSASAPVPATGPDHPLELSVLTYNVRGLPWPVARGRGQALREIGRELGDMRQAHRQPDIVLIQEGFRGAAHDLIRESGYRYWAAGPRRGDRMAGTPPDGADAYPRVKYRQHGEGWGKAASAGLYVLSDYPILSTASRPYGYCAGWDCLANKGVMLVHIAAPGLPQGIDVVNTHLNSRRAAKVPIARSLAAYDLQTEEMNDFIRGQRTPATPLLVGGDFNVMHAPERYSFNAARRGYQVVSELCHAAASRCEEKTPYAGPTPWLQTEDLQAFAEDGGVRIQPLSEALVFARQDGRGLSDHDGYLVRYRIDPPPGATTTLSAR